MKLEGIAKEKSEMVAAVCQGLIQWHTAKILDIFQCLESSFVN